jgi:hypothetical protein
MVTRHGDATHTMDYEIKDNRLWQEGDEILVHKKDAEEYSVGFSRGETDWKSR